MRQSKNPDRVSNISKNLNTQLDAAFSHFNEGSFKTRERYHEAMERFIDFLAEKYGTQKLENFGNKQFIAYVNDMIDRGLSTRTITTDMSGIRYFKYHTTQRELVDNSQFTFKKRETNKYDRSWSIQEIEKAKTLAKEQGRHDIYHALSISSAFGLRLEETVRLKYGIAAKAIETYELDVVGKGGQERSIYVETLEQISALTDIALYANKIGKKAYDKIFVDRVKGSTKRKKQSIENWIKNHREKFEDKDRQNRLNDNNLKQKTLHVTFHGLRYYYCNFIYRTKKEENIMTERELKRYISERLGHHRVEITKIYLMYLKV